MYDFGPDTILLDSGDKSEIFLTNLLLHKLSQSSQFSRVLCTGNDTAQIEKDYL